MVVAAALVGFVRFDKKKDKREGKLETRASLKCAPSDDSPSRSHQNNHAIHVHRSGQGQRKRTLPPTSILNFLDNLNFDRLVVTYADLILNHIRW